MNTINDQNDRQPQPPKPSVERQVDRLRAARILKYDLATFDQLVKRGYIRANRTADGPRFSITELREFVDEWRQDDGNMDGLVDYDRAAQMLKYDLATFEDLVLKGYFRVIRTEDGPRFSIKDLRLFVDDWRGNDEDGIPIPLPVQSLQHELRNEVYLYLCWHAQKPESTEEIYKWLVENATLYGAFRRRWIVLRDVEKSLLWLQKRRGIKSSDGGKTWHGDMGIPSDLRDIARHCFYNREGTD